MTLEVHTVKLLFQDLNAGSEIRAARSQCNLHS